MNRLPHRPLPSRSRLTDLFFYSTIEGALYWRNRPANNVDIARPAGAISSSGYYQIMVDKIMYKRHRLIWCYHNDDPGQMEVDHVNRIRTDDRIENLRLATREENSRNRNKESRNTSGFIGVSWNRRLNKWAAYIGSSKGNLHIGVYEDINDAVAARIAAEVKRFCKFAPSKSTTSAQ
jgi:hypothetical protein